MHTNKWISLLALLLLLQACVSVDDQYSKNEKASKINVELGIGYLRQNNLDQASEKLLKAIRQDPDSAPAHNAYAILQERLKQLDLAEYHYKKAVSLDSRDSQSSNNYGAFLCRNGREAESEEYFLAALKNPLYKTPEYAYTNAALCLNKINQKNMAKEYLHKALASNNNFGVALYALSKIYFEEGQYDKVKLYMDHYQLVAQPTAQSLWLAIRAELEIDSDVETICIYKSTHF